MMNIFTQWNTSESKSSFLNAKEKKQSSGKKSGPFIGQKFSQLMMGLLGLNSQDKKVVTDKPEKTTAGESQYDAQHGDEKTIFLGAKSSSAKKTISSQLEKLHEPKGSENREITSKNEAGEKPRRTMKTGAKQAVSTAGDVQTRKVDPDQNPEKIRPKPGEHRAQKSDKASMGQKVDKNVKAEFPSESVSGGARAIPTDKKSSLTSIPIAKAGREATSGEQSASKPSRGVVNAQHDSSSKIKQTADRLLEKQEPGNQKKQRALSLADSGREPSSVSDKQSEKQKRFTMKSVASASNAAVDPEKNRTKNASQKSVDTDFDPSKIVDKQKASGRQLNMELQARSEHEQQGRRDGKLSNGLAQTSSQVFAKSSGRQEFSGQLVRHLQQQTQSGKPGSAKAWNRHRFVMDDGKVLNVAIRHSEGTMQLQLQAGNSELNKMIRQHIDEIRHYVQEQMNVKIDLQLQHFADQQPSDQGAPFGTERQAPQDEISSASRDYAGSESQATPVIRYLGFNNNEWTA